MAYTTADHHVFDMLTDSPGFWLAVSVVVCVLLAGLSYFYGLAGENAAWVSEPILAP